MQGKQHQVSEVKLIYKNEIPVSERVTIKSARDAFKLIYDRWDKDNIEFVEEFKILLLNRSHQVLGICDISKGGTVGTVIDIKLIMAYAIKTNCSSLIAVHNHPSGNLNPSEADIKITTKLRAACEVMDINFLDHLIITPQAAFYSFSDSGL